MFIRLLPIYQPFIITFLLLFLATFTTITCQRHIPAGRFLGAGTASGAGGSAMEGAEKKYDARFAAGIILMRNIYMYVRINKLCFIYLACSLQ